jgi:hypothetical protein
MKILHLCTVLIVTAFLAASCANNAQNNATTTPTDSTNINGTAPVTYGPDSPASSNPNGPMNSVADTGLRANTANHDDSVHRGLAPRK